jgi:MFS family permease
MYLIYQNHIPPPYHLVYSFHKIIVTPAGQIVGQVTGGLLLNMINNYPKTKVVYLLIGVIVPVLSTSVIAFTTTVKNESVIPLWFAILLFFITFLFLVTPYNLVQGLFSVRYGGKYQGMCNGITDGGSYLGTMVFAFYAGNIIKEFGYRGFYFFVTFFGILGLIFFSIFLIVDYYAEKNKILKVIH